MKTALAALVLSGSVALPSAFAANPEKTATKALVAAQESALAEFTSAVNASVATFRAAVKDIEKDLDPGADGMAQADLLFDALVALQAAVTAAVTEAAQEQADGAKAALATLAPPVEGQYPPAFYPGARTVTAAFEDAVDKKLASVYRKLNKRVANTVAKFDEVGTHVAFRLDPPRRPRRNWTSSFVDSFVVNPPTIDVVLAFSTDAADADGQIRAGGAAREHSPFIGDVTVLAAFNLVSESDQATPADGRYTVDFGGSSFAEGDWLLGASQEISGSSDVSIGVR